MKPNKHFGKEATDSITGFVGTVTGFAQYITGCDQYLVTPSCKEGDTSKVPDSHWFDENRLSFNKKTKKVKVDTKDAKGPMDMAPIK